MKKTTSFGSMEILLEKDGKVISEFMVFEKEGRNHLHNYWEICYVISGEGIIVNGEDKVQVKKGDVCKIPPMADHWMIPNGRLEILLIYSEQP